MANVDDAKILRRFTEEHLAARLAAAGDAPLRLVALHASRSRDPETAARLGAGDLDRHWLVLLDAEGWLLDQEPRAEARAACLTREDLEALRPLLAAHVRGGRPGAFAVFVGDVDAQHAKSFRTHALRLADRLGLERAVLGVAATDTTRHLGVVMSSCEALAAGTAEAWHAHLREG